ncbi:hypothetical protein ACFLUH_02390 [Chloroflexota bacterium]
MKRCQFESRIIDFIATGLLVSVTSLWIFWGVRGVCYGGENAWYHNLLYLLPGIISLVLILIALSRPKLAGWLIIILGGAFTIYWWWYISTNIGLNPERVLVMFPLSGMLVIAGVFIILGKRQQPLLIARPLSPIKQWFYRNNNYMLAIGLPLVLAVGLAIAVPTDDFPQTLNANGEVANYGGSQQFRDSTVQFVRTVSDNYFEQSQTQYPEELHIKGNWDVAISIYHQGEIKGQGEYEERDELLSLVLEDATRNALEGRQQDLNEESIENARFLIDFRYNLSILDQINVLFTFFPYSSYFETRSFTESEGSYSFIEYQGEGKELMENLVAIRNLDKELILRGIEQGKEFLLSAENEDTHGFYKKYEALTDDFGNRVHTVYSASIIYTLLKIYDYDNDERILECIPYWSDFLLSMQSKDAETYGAFHYSYYYETKIKEPRFVVGTTALSIFTLLDLYNLTDDPRYLESARLGGDWLVTMQKPDGVMKAHKEYKGNEWVYGEDESLLYNGQVLSALSRLYNATGDMKYYDAAEKIANHFTQRVENEGCYLGDDYRIKNTISSAWVAMSLLDFYQVSQDDYYKEIIFRCSRGILERQETNTNNLLYYGTWHRAYSTSGNGWLAEVMVEMYKFCQEYNMDGCDRYKEAIIRVTLWLLQNTYSEENTFSLKEPENAIGGIFWNYENSYVRTDSLCHGLNAYIMILNEVDDGTILSIPEESLHITLNKLSK